MTVREGETRLSRSAWRVLRRGDFGLYFTGNLASSIGTWLQNTAQVLLAYQLTRSVLAVGVVTCVQFSGSLLLSPWAAVIASRIGSKRVLVVLQAFSAVVAAVMAAFQTAGRLGVQGLILGALGLGLAFTFALPVQTALIPGMVAEADTEAAMAMNSVAYNIGRALAPALCVLVVRLTGFAWAFGLNAVSFLAFALMLAKVAPQAIPCRRARARDGIRIAARVPRVALLLAMVAAVTLADDPILTLGPALARDLGAPSDWAGFFLSALGCGTVVGSLWPTKDPGEWEPGRTARWAAWPLVALVLFIATFAAGASKWVSLAAAFLTGAAALRTSAVTQAQLSRERPESKESVLALWAIAWAGTKPLASLTDGWVASTNGLRWAVFAVAVPALVLGLLELCLPDSWKARIKASLTSLTSRGDDQSIQSQLTTGLADGTLAPDSQTAIVASEEPLIEPAPFPRPRGST